MARAKLEMPKKIIMTLLSKTKKQTNNKLTSFLAYLLKSSSYSNPKT